LVPALIDFLPFLGRHLYVIFFLFVLGYQFPLLMFLHYSLVADVITGIVAADVVELG
jgi:hypothetical protein